MLKAEVFVADDEKAATIPISFRKVEVPTIERQEFIEKEMTENLRDTFASAVKAIMAGNLFISLLFATALQYLWGMINALQMIMLAGLFRILYPDNLQVITIEVTKACNFDFYQTEDLYSDWFGFGDSPSFSEAFDEADFGGSIFMVGLGTMLSFVFGFPTFLLIRLIARWLMGG